MKVETDNLELNIVGVLVMINSEDDIKSVFDNQDFGVDMNILISNAKKGILEYQDVNNFIKYIFDNIITRRKEYINQYLEILEKLEKSNKLPRRYGKVAILEDVKKQGGNITEVQQMLIEANDIKNLLVKIQRKGISAHFGEEEMDDKECREIKGALMVLKTRLSNL